MLLSRYGYHSYFTRMALAAVATAALVVPLGAADSPNTLTAAEKAAGWRLLFDGSSTAGWRGYNKPDMSGLRWIVKDGAVCLPPADGADTRGQSRHHHRRHLRRLRPDVAMAGAARQQQRPEVLRRRKRRRRHRPRIPDHRRCQACRTPKISTERQTASFYDVKAATARPTKPIGEWNTSRVLVQGNHVEHWLNGTKVLEYELGSPETLAAVQDSKFKTNAGFGTKKPGPHPAAGPRRRGVLPQRQGSAGDDVGNCRLQIADCRLQD